MILGLDDTQQALHELAATIFTDHADGDRIAAIEASPDGFDRDLWWELAAAGLLGVTIPESHGGLGLGAVEQGIVCEELGRIVAPIPLVATGCGTALIARFGSDEQRAEWLPLVSGGSAVIAVAPPQAVIDVRRDGERLSGDLIGIAWAHVADLLLIPVGDGVVAIDPTADGVTGTRVTTTAREIGLTLHLDDVVGEGIGGAVAADWLRARWLVALAGLQAGVTAGALRMTATYTSSREQFGRPLSTFQGVALKAADGYLDTTAIQSCARQAAWWLDRADGDSDEDTDATDDPTLAVLTAAWWAAEAGQHCVHLSQHLHGGLGADITYPVHRFFLWGKQIELLLGGASAILAELGDALAARPGAGDAIAL